MIDKTSARSPVLSKVRPEAAIQILYMKYQEEREAGILIGCVVPDHGITVQR